MDASSSSPEPPARPPAAPHGADGSADDPGPRVLDLAVGTGATGLRVEHDSLGEVQVPAERYWGAQTQRSLEHFAIGGDRLPPELHHAYAYVKKAAALANAEFGRLPRWMAGLIARVCDEIIAGALDGEFPLFVWQTGSGTQTNMNLNEVIANRADQLVGAPLGAQAPVHPNDHVNMSQSSNDSFPAAAHVAVARALSGEVLPSGRALVSSVRAKAAEFDDVVKLGRTHLQDAVPLTVGQEWNGWASQLEEALAAVGQALPGVCRLPLGGTAVGTGLNAPAGFGAAATARLAGLTGLPFAPAADDFAALGGQEALLRASSSLRGLAAALLKIANDVRLLASGPRAGLHELVLPANEPGSSIMPGKVNPTQAEALAMVAVQVMGLDAAVGFAGGLGTLQLTTMRPLVAADVLRMARLLGDAMDHFRRFCVEGMQLDRERIATYVERSLMLVTALSPLIGYDRAADIAQRALADDVPLRDAAIASGHVTAEEYDRLVDPARMARPADGD